MLSAARTMLPRAASTLTPSGSVGRSVAPSVARAAAITPSFGQAQRRGYHEKVIDHYENPRNVGSFAKGDDIGIGLVGAPACGDVMKLSIKVSESGIIEDVRFKTFGCGSAIASSSLVTEKLKGLTLEEAGRIRNTEIAQELSLPPVKLHCSMLAEDAVKAAVRDYKTKRDQAIAQGQKPKPGHIDVSQSVTTGQTTATANVDSGFK
ncbi:cluster assembly scaffold [Ceraceosorus bombacis]|uniref:Iron-sulfur cluster assembly protein n=1 Tax=Ceraceosorus bombacis TaxID=401625 RepID=A0A0P1BB70_9BASI|nr:cluster assembly scaffold [Ceraceosorus bombacis]